MKIPIPIPFLYDNAHVLKASSIKSWFGKADVNQLKGPAQSSDRSLTEGLRDDISANLTNAFERAEIPTPTKTNKWSDVQILLSKWCVLRKPTQTCEGENMSNYTQTWVFFKAGWWDAMAITKSHVWQYFGSNTVVVCRLCTVALKLLTVEQSRCWLG